MLVISTKLESSRDTRCCLCHTKHNLSRLPSKSEVVTMSISSCKFSVRKSIFSMKVEPASCSIWITYLASWSKTLPPPTRKSAKLKNLYKLKKKIRTMFVKNYKNIRDVPGKKISSVCRLLVKSSNSWWSTSGLEIILSISVKLFTSGPIGDIVEQKLETVWGNKLK